ncbi:hypothetical protein ABIE21_000479 [Conyzicola nivalis]|uniref:site-specific DNA-methyltransferase (adenine-specific) n=1 Tax=Conyzicola nivalis TaxID=1477021 RepID=A0ABV2QIW9_9MICO
METAPLKSFATWARTALIREVNARIVAVLAPASTDRVESASAVAALERDIAAEGGGDAVADKVAYTWFNRIIALRFMDANGYTGIGVVSPARGQTTGQPEVLADAKRGNIDFAVVMNKRGIETITALLDGTRRSDDPQGEAYALLLAEYCRHWNRSMPFMFEREGDYTELLIPANMLADDSVVARAATVLTEDVCRDVEVIGWLYQFYISERKDEVFAGFKKNKKAGAAEIPAATQLFTPHWIVRYLVENSLGRLWMLNRPSSGLVDRMQYYVEPVDEESDFLRVSSPEELKVMDPAVGSGHMLTYAFDLLYAIYEEEGYAPADIPGLILQNNLYGTEIDPRAGVLAAFALAMKARAKQRTFFSRGIQPHICVLTAIRFDEQELDYLAEPGIRTALTDAYHDHDRSDVDDFWNTFERADTFGSLIQPRAEFLAPLKRHLEDRPPKDGDLLADKVFSRAIRVTQQAEYLSRSYSVIVANPPYMGSGNMSDLLGEYASINYPGSKSNLYAMFVERCMAFASRKGIVGMITMEGWMFLGSFAGLRQRLLRSNAVRNMAHLGVGAFDSIGGQVVATSAFILATDIGQDSPAAYVRLVEEPNEAAKSSVLRSAVKDAGHPERHRVNAQALLEIPSAIMAYWMQPEAVEAFRLGTVSQHAQSEGAVKTGDNARYLRMVWEVSAKEIGESNHWRRHPKGGGFRRWYGNVDTVVDWSASARAHYRNDRIARIPSKEIWGLTGITWSSVSTDRASFRLLESHEIANNAALFIFPNDPSRIHSILGYLNSDFAAEYLEAVAPTINYLVGDVMSLPLPAEFVDEKTLNTNVEKLISLSHDLWDESETSAGFARLHLLELGAARLGDALFSTARQQAERLDRIRAVEEDNERLLRLTFGHIAAPMRSTRQSASRHTSGPQYRDLLLDLVSYSVGCMFGRYSLDKPELILASQGETLQEYLAKVPRPSFMPDNDNIIPIVDGDWFEDDIVARFRQFLRVAFGEEYFEENLRFVTESLGVKDLRDYFVKSFYKDHVQRYKKRPIYWLFSSPKGSFNALMYMHRYTTSTVSTVLNEYLREFKSKLEASRQHHERLVLGTGTPREKAAAEKEVDRLRKVLLELDEYEHDVLYPLATQQLAIDLDDGVKVNYPKFGAALKKIPGLEASDE